MQGGTVLPQSAMKHHGLPGEAQDTTLRSWIRHDCGGTPDLFQLWKTSRNILWLLQIPTRKRNHGKKQAELGVKGWKKKTTPNLSNHLPNQPCQFWLLAHHVVLEQVLPFLAHGIFTYGIYFIILLSCAHDLPSAQPLSLPLPSCYLLSISSAYTSNFFWYYL